MKNQVEKSIKWKPVKFIKWWYMQDQFHTWIRMMGSQKNGLYKMFSPMSNPTTSFWPCQFTKWIRSWFCNLYTYGIVYWYSGYILKDPRKLRENPWVEPRCGKIRGDTQMVVVPRCRSSQQHSNTFSKDFPKILPKMQINMYSFQKNMKNIETIEKYET